MGVQGQKPKRAPRSRLKDVAAVVEWLHHARQSNFDLEPLKPQGSRGGAPLDQRSRGADATAPHDIPPRGWFEILKRTAKKFSENELMSEAAGVTFFALLSLFPAITAMVSIFGLFADPATIRNHLVDVSGIIPSGGMQIIEDQVTRLTQTPSTGLSVGATVGVLTALWSANQGSKAMISALNDVYGERESRGFVRLTATSLAFTVGGVIGLLLALGAILVLPLAFDFFGLGGAYALAVTIVRWPIIASAVIGALALLYRFGPSRNLAKWRWVTWGSAIGAIGWLALSFGFSWYVQHFGSYNKTYGSLGAIVGFMTWIWLSSTMFLLGAQVNAEMETQTNRDSTVGPEKRIGTRGAAPADVKTEVAVARGA